MAAEAFLDALPPPSSPQFRGAFIQALEDGNGHASKFPPILAEEFADSYEIIAHQDHTSTGFSGTLFRCKVTDAARGLVAGEYTLSFGSTESVEDSI